MDRMNQIAMSVDNRVQVLEQRTNKNESKHMVDTRDTQTLKYKEVITTYGVPLGIFGAVVVTILEAIKITKVFMK